MQNLYEQLTAQEIEALASILGFSQVGAGFRTYLRDIPPLPENFKMGDVLQAYLDAVQAMLNRTK